MKIKKNEKFAICPSWEDCFSSVFPVNLKVGSIFTSGGESSLSKEGGRLFQWLRRVTKVEPLKDHPDHLVISSVLVGTTVSKFVYEQVSVRTNNGFGEHKLAVTAYYDEEHTKKVDCRFPNNEKAEIFFISTSEKPKYYLVDISKFNEVRVPIEEKSICLGYF